LVALSDSDNTIGSIVKLLGIFRTTIYKYVPNWPAEVVHSSPQRRRTRCSSEFMIDPLADSAVHALERPRFYQATPLDPDCSREGTTRQGHP
jgi:hypothetical protein